MKPGAFPKTLAEPEVLQWELDKIRLFCSRQIKLLPAGTVGRGWGREMGSSPSCDPEAFLFTTLLRCVDAQLCLKAFFYYVATVPP